MELKEIELSLVQLRVDKEAIERDRIYKLTALDNQIDDLLRQKYIILQNYNLDKVTLAEKYIYTAGILKYYGMGATVDCLNDCISDVAKGLSLLKIQCFGCKNYEGWTCQRCDCEYGYSPNHGSIVFEIGLRNQFRNEQFSDDTLNAILYYLGNLKSEAFRNTLFNDVNKNHGS
jgi:hypothetical protein